MNIQYTGNKMYDLVKDLFPICRSITGDGVRKTLEIIKNYIPIETHEISSGTKVFDWVIPKEWNIKDAYVKNSKGEKIIDFKKSNLHILNYSIPVKKKVSLNELKKHIFTLPEYPKWIPYRTSYYEENWGFCISHEQFEKLTEDEYEIVISSTLKEGHLTFGELFLKGESEKEILFSCYICHPSMCNDNLSGVSLLTFLAKFISKKKLKYSYRFLFIPETIGAITWLSLNEKKVNNIQGGLVATCLADQGHVTYKKTRMGNSVIDKIVEKILKESGEKYEIIDFFPSGSDERQFSSPGFNLPIGSVTRTLYGKFPEYHTSADNLDLVHPKYFQNTFEKYIKIFMELEDTFEKNEIKKDGEKNISSNKKRIQKNENELIFQNLYPKCEPNLGKRGLYDMIGAKKDELGVKMSIFWVLNLSDGKNSLSDISKQSKIKSDDIKLAAEHLVKAGLIKLI
ncbi:MAG: peptidase M28 [Thaumarchaeota archaeon]|nr:MAG: peptidase M28 [Nitrososphaerota archaeon]